MKPNLLKLILTSEETKFEDGNFKLTTIHRASSETSFMRNKKEAHLHTVSINRIVEFIHRVQDPDDPCTELSTLDYCYLRDNADTLLHKLTVCRLTGEWRNNFTK